MVVRRTVRLDRLQGSSSPHCGKTISIHCFGTCRSKRNKHKLRHNSRHNSKPTAPDVSDTVLWQPHRPSAHEDLLGSQPQEMAASVAESLDGPLSQGTKPSLGSKPAVPSARRTVLWQPCRSASNQQNPRDTQDVGSSSHLSLSSIEPSGQV